MVGARGFEPPTSWSRTVNQLRINNLATLRLSTIRCPMWRAINQLSAESRRIATTCHNRSVHRVGIVLGIVATASM